MTDQNKSPPAHTPGTWTACLSLFNGWATGFHITGDKYGSLHPICSYDEFTGHKNIYPSDQIKANARLIAAAPELLEALQNAIEYAAAVFVGKPENEWPVFDLTKAMAARDKAKGSSS